MLLSTLIIPIYDSKQTAISAPRNVFVCMHEEINQRPAVPLSTHNLFHQSPSSPLLIPTQVLLAWRRGPLLGVCDGFLSGKPGLVLGRCVSGTNGASSQTPIEIYHLLYSSCSFFGYGDGSLLCVLFCRIEGVLGDGKWCLPYCRSESGLHIWRKRRHKTDWSMTG